MFSNNRTGKRVPPTEQAVNVTCWTEGMPLNSSLSLLSAVPEKLMEMVLHCLVIHFDNVMNDLSFQTRKCISR